jgi:hypothetical protein
MAINPAAAVGILLASPVQFLKRFPVRIFGDMGASRPVTYTMLNRNPGASKRPGFVLGTMNMHDTEVLEIRSPAAMAAAAGAGGSVFNAHSIHMDAGSAGMNFYLLDGTGPAIMVTGQLSGCSFVMLPAGAGHVNVAHVQPQGQTGAALQGTLANGLPNAQIYGAAGTTGNYDSSDRVASVIGVRIAGQWRIYAQKQDAGSGDYRIRSVYQIYPSRQKV